jgi:hypothetical protein
MEVFREIYHSFILLRRVLSSRRVDCLEMHRLFSSAMTIFTTGVSTLCALARRLVNL